MATRVMGFQQILPTAVSIIFSVPTASVGAAAAGTPQNVDLVGELTIYHSDDFQSNRGHDEYVIEEEVTHRRFKLKGRVPPGLQSGMKLKVHGRSQGDGWEVAAANSTQQVTTLSVGSSTATVTGAQHALVMMLDFADVSQSCSVQQVRDSLFTSPTHYDVDSYYQETSFGKVSFDGEVVGPFAIPYTTTGACDYSAWANAADSLAQQSGVDLTQFNRRVYVLPSTKPCGWGGLGTVGGNPSRAWVAMCNATGIYTHELGHNLGMHHASTATSEYGDSSDVMGSFFHQVNAAHKAQMGWLPPAQTPTVTTAGVYTIEASEIAPPLAMAPQALKIAKPDTNDYYYLSYRMEVGFDLNLNTIYNTFTGGVNIHRHAGGATRTYYLGTLTDNGVYADAPNGIRFTQLAHSDNSVTVQIDFNAAPVDTLPPSVPTALTGTVKRRQINLVWTAATDNVGVSGYAVWRNGVRLGTTTRTSFVDSTASRGSNPSYFVTAHDVAGNSSAGSNTVRVVY